MAYGKIDPLIAALQQRLEALEVRYALVELVLIEQIRMLEQGNGGYP